MEPGAEAIKGGGPTGGVITGGGKTRVPTQSKLTTPSQIKPGAEKKEKSRKLVRTEINE